jgi:general L-amino acid transport system substrate-binding protein
MRKLFAVLSVLVMAVLLVSCGSPAPSGEPQKVIETVVVTVVVPGEAPTVAPATPLPAIGGERLQAVLDRGKLICGVHGSFQGFGFVDSAGAWTGFDVDFCRAWAAALFNDANAVEFRGLSAQTRFTALQSGEVDVLSRNSTWTWTRDAELGLTLVRLLSMMAKPSWPSRMLWEMLQRVCLRWKARMFACKVARPPNLTLLTNSVLRV